MLRATPSNFNSHVYSISLIFRIFLTLLSKSSSSSLEYVFDKESIGDECVIVLNFLVIFPPILILGELIELNSGNFFSKSIRLLIF